MRTVGVTNFQRSAGAPPATPVVGDTYYDTTSSKPFYFDGTLWQPFTSDGVIAPLSMLNATVTANTALGNAAAGTTLPLSQQEILGADISLINNQIQFNTAGTYLVVMNATVSSTIAGWFILNAWLPGGIKKSVVGACVATPWFDEATLSFNYTAAAGDVIYFSAQANQASGFTCDARSICSVTKVAVGPGPQGPQGPPGPNAGSVLQGQWQRSGDLSMTGNIETVIVTTGAFLFQPNRCYEIRASAALNASTTTTRTLCRIYNVTDALRVNLCDTNLSLANVFNRFTAPYIFRPGSVARNVEFQLTAQAASTGNVVASGTPPQQCLLQVWDIGPDSF